MADVVTNDLEAVKAQLQAKEERLAVAATAIANQGEHLAAACATLSESKAGADELAALLAEERARWPLNAKKVKEGLVQIPALAKQR